MNTNWRKDYIRYKSLLLNLITLYKTKPNILLYLELVLSIIAIAVFSIFAIKPTITTIIELNKKLKAKESTLILLKQKAKSLQIASSILQTRADDLLYVNQAVPNLAEPEVFFNLIESIAAQNSISLIRINVNDVTLYGKDAKKKDQKSDSLASYLPFTFSVSGQYQNIIMFTKQIENLRRPILFDSYSYSSSVTESEKKITLTVTGRLPYLQNENL